MSLVVFAWTLLPGPQAVASCGDYLYKPGAAKSDMTAPMELHEEHNCNEDQRDPLPVFPPPTLERQSDELGGTCDCQIANARLARATRESNSAAAIEGFGLRIDRPPQR